MTPDEQKRILLLAEQVAGIDPTLGYWLAHHAGATRNEGRATLSPICFHLFERVGRTPPEECVCGGDAVTGSPWVGAEPPARPKPEPKAEPKAERRFCIVHSDDGTVHRVHRVGCRDVPPGAGDWVISLLDPDRDLVAMVEHSINCDFARDDGQTVAEYLSEGNGYTVDGGHIKILPCCGVTPASPKAEAPPEPAADGAPQIVTVAANSKQGRPRDTYSVLGPDGKFWRSAAGKRRAWQSLASAKAAVRAGRRR